MAILLLLIVGAMERFVLMKASTSASVILFRRCEVREIRLTVKKENSWSNLLEVTDKFLEKRDAISLELSS